MQAPQHYLYTRDRGASILGTNPRSHACLAHTHLHALMPETAHPQIKPTSNAVPVALNRILPNVVLCPPAGLIWPCDLGYRPACVCSVPFTSCVVEGCRRARVFMVYFSCLLTCIHFLSQALCFFARSEPDSVRAELGRCARPGFASFQVLTRTLFARNTSG